MASSAGDPLLPGEPPHRRRFLPPSIRLKTSVWSELGGAVGDLGTYIPIVLALSLASHLDLGTTLIFTALYNFASGVLFGIPMPVQPMKSIAAVALSSAHLTVPQIMGAGIAVAAILLFLGATGLMTRLYRVLPLPVVRGVQLSQGLSFAFPAVKYIRYDQDFSRSSSASTSAAVPQLPLSVLNSVIAVCKLSSDLFPEQAELSPARVSVSVGLMNLVGCWFGAMPCCHGAGGLAGQYRFGGGGGASVVFLAMGKLALGLVFGNSFVTILGEFPIGILGVMLLFSGVELAMASRDMGSKEESFVMLVCAGVSLTGSSAALGFIAGVVLHLLLRLREVDCGELVGRLRARRYRWLP
uniref:Molybdate transporter 2 n=1 Tax=Aegilops tauschii TaxID=37682 RepID=R7WFN1_AEGTA